MKKFDVAIIGSGPGGYVCAIRCAQLGKKAALIEKEKVGGVCLNVGCIPSKALIHVSELFRSFQTAEAFGLKVKGVEVQAGALQDYKNGVVKKLTGGIGQLLKANRVELIQGQAIFQSNRELSVHGDVVAFDHAVIAAGSSPAVLKGFEPEEKFVGTSTEGLSYKAIPEELCVIGGGYIGLEIGSLYAGFGSKVTVVEATDALLPGTDPDLVQVVARELQHRDVKVCLKSKATGWKKEKDKALVTVQTEKGQENIRCDKILVAVGRIPNTKNLGLEKIGVALDEKGFITVDERRETNVKGIFAIGDCAGGVLLAHKASKEGLIAAGVIAGRNEVYDVRAMPAVIFTTPEIAYAGLSEEQAKAGGRRVKIGKFPFLASGKALATGHTDGFVKIVSDAQSDEVLGVFMVGADVSNLIGEACLAIEMGATAQDIARTVHPHPTLTESLMESAEAVHGSAIHIFAR